MKYNLDDLHWQEFEVLSFKILQILISIDIQFIEGGNDKGRDIVYEGISNYNIEYTGKWIFQVKHKSKLDSDGEISSTLVQDLKKELTKVFLVNKLNFDNYILVTNKVINGSTFDQLNETFFTFISANNIECRHFNIIGYRHIESCVEQNESLRWAYPNIIKHPDFQLLIKNAINYNLENRKRGWLNGINKHRENFVNTQFFEKANEKFKNYPAIILSGPPKSGKTFNAEILALNYSIYKDYQPFLIDHPEEIESVFEFERKQIFVCDDAFGKYSLSYKAEEWFLKLDRIFNLADESHLFIFTSREYIYRAFLNFGNDDAKANLEKITVESHNYQSHEKLAILKRYTANSKLPEFDKESILREEIALINHKNFSPETVRAFFANLNSENNSNQLAELKAHLEKPDSYLSKVFFTLTNIKQAVLLSVLCTVKNEGKSVYKKFDSLCTDLNITAIVNPSIEFDELDDSILRIEKTDVVEGINFYHPSMQEFLTRELISNETGKLRQVVLQNLNTDLLSISILKSSENTFLPISTDEKIQLRRNDVNKIQIGLDRLIKNEDISVYQVASIFKWFKSEQHTIDLKIFDVLLFKDAKNIVYQLTKVISSDDFYYLHKNEANSVWSYLFFILKNVLTFYGIDKSTHNFCYLEKILKEKADEKSHWMLVFRILSFTNDEFIIATMGRIWLNSFYTKLRNDMYELGFEIFGIDFPHFNDYNKSVRNKISVEKVKEKPNKYWYPRFLHVEERVDILKEVKGTKIGNTILERLSKEYEGLKKQKEFAKNRHGFNLKQGWWHD